MNYRIDRNNLDHLFPTQKHPKEFWEALGRVIATFGFLEETLLKAIFIFIGNKLSSEELIEKEKEKLLKQLLQASSDPMHGLINKYNEVFNNHPENSKFSNFKELINLLNEAKKIRNVLCHGSWRAPNENGASRVFFINRQLYVFDTPIDLAFLTQTRQHVSELICEVKNSVTIMGWQFPGSNSHGKTLNEIFGLQHFHEEGLDK